MVLSSYNSTVLNLLTHFLISSDFQGKTLRFWQIFPGRNSVWRLSDPTVFTSKMIKNSSPGSPCTTIFCPSSNWTGSKASATVRRSHLSRDSEEGEHRAKLSHEMREQKEFSLSLVLFSAEIFLKFLFKFIFISAQVKYFSYSIFNFCDVAYLKINK